MFLMKLARRKPFADLSLANYYFAHNSSGFPSCYDSAMRNLVVLFIHLITTLASLLGPGGVRPLVAESLILKPYQFARDRLLSFAILLAAEER